MKTNPKTHDALFKCLITSFTEEFFAHYFPDIPIGHYSFVDKEFISKYEALKESLRGDLFLMTEAEIGGGVREILIQIEHQSERADVSERVYEYSCYAWLLKRKPVWSIVVFTDDDCVTHIKVKRVSNPLCFSALHSPDAQRFARSFHK